jgi:DNA-binding CsgD family transcriptional regulator
MKKAEKPECAKLADDVTLYAWGGLASDARTVVETHLKECASCNEFVSFLKEFIAAARKDGANVAIPPGPHPDPSLIVGLEADKLDAETERKVSLHLLDCRACREAYLRLRSLSNEQFEEHVLEEVAHPSQRLLAEHAAAIPSSQIYQKPKQFLIDLGKTYGENALLGPIRVLKEENWGGYAAINEKRLEMKVEEDAYLIMVKLLGIGNAWELSFTIEVPVNSKAPLSATVYSEAGKKLTTRHFQYLGCHLSVPVDLQQSAQLQLALNFKVTEERLLFRLPAKTKRAVSRRQGSKVLPGEPLLSDFEKAIVQLVAQGYRNDAIAEKLSLSDEAVKEHLNSIFAKLGISNSSELSSYAIDSGLIDRL